MAPGDLTLPSLPADYLQIKIHWYNLHYQKGIFIHSLSRFRQESSHYYPTSINLGLLSTWNCSPTPSQIPNKKSATKRIFSQIKSINYTSFLPWEQCMFTQKKQYSLSCKKIVLSTTLLRTNIDTHQQHVPPPNPPTLPHFPCHCLFSMHQRPNSSPTCDNSPLLGIPCDRHPQELVTFRKLKIVAGIGIPRSISNTSVMRILDKAEAFLITCRRTDECSSQDKFPQELSFSPSTSTWCIYQQAIARICPKHSTLRWQQWDPMVTSCSQNYNDSITLRKAMSSTSRRAGATEEIMGGRDDSQPRKKNSVIVPLYIFRWLSQLSGSPRNHWVHSITRAGAYEWFKASNQGPLISQQQDCCCLFQRLYHYTQGKHPSRTQEKLHCLGARHG